MPQKGGGEIESSEASEVGLFGFQTHLLLLSPRHIETWQGKCVPEFRVSNIMEKLVLRIKY